MTVSGSENNSMGVNGYEKISKISSIGLKQQIKKYKSKISNIENSNANSKIRSILSSAPWSTLSSLNRKVKNLEYLKGIVKNRNNNNETINDVIKDNAYDDNQFGFGFKKIIEYDESKILLLKQSLRSCPKKSKPQIVKDIKECEAEIKGIKLFFKRSQISSLKQDVGELQKKLSKKKSELGGNQNSTFHNTFNYTDPKKIKSEITTIENEIKEKQKDLKEAQKIAAFTLRERVTNFFGGLFPPKQQVK